MSESHTYKRGDPVVVYDRGKWRKGKVIDTHSKYGVIVHVEDYEYAIHASADDDTIRHREDADA